MNENTGSPRLAETPVQRLTRELENVSAASDAASGDCVKAAVLLLAAGARESLPCAKRINLSETDLPPVLWVDDIDGDETFAELAEAGGLFGHAASRLHTAHLHASPHLHGEGGGRWHIDIAEALR